MKLQVLVLFATVITWCVVAVDGACYETVLKTATVVRYRYHSQKYYYRTFIFGWVRKSKYRAVRSSYYAQVLQYKQVEKRCPVDGGWGPWKKGSCSVTCGTGFVWSYRTCDNPAPAHGGRYCFGPDRKVDRCPRDCCPVHGGWHSWLPGSCSKTCGGGVMKFIRECTNPKPSCGGNDCPGAGVREEACNAFCCPVDGVWSEWIDLGDCSRACGGGSQEQFRSCDSPEAICGGRACVGPRTRVTGCNPECCPVKGGWTVWKDAAECSRTCGGGFKEQVRSCTNPLPQCGGDACIGEENRTVSCNDHCCPVDGDWNGWVDISVCSASCGTGYKEQNRSCSNPPHSCGGAPCAGNDHRLVLCNTGCCPVDGGWSEWKDETKCSRSCGKGVVTQSRTCTQPGPECGGSDCHGDNFTTSSCNSHCCPVDGRWSNWKVGKCSVECGGGVREKIRSCDQPAPYCGGKECSGDMVQVIECNEQPCEDVYGEWGNYSECSVTCGGIGMRSRRRECSGKCENVSATIEIEDCDMGCCPVDGGWTEWKPESSCSATCGDSKEEHSRSCTNPAPSCGGKQCEGLAVKIKDCGLAPCPSSLPKLDG